MHNLSKIKINKLCIFVIWRNFPNIATNLYILELASTKFRKVCQLKIASVTQ